MERGRAASGGGELTRGAPLFLSSQVLHDRLVLASDVYNTQICKSCGSLGEVQAPSLGGMLEGVGFKCRACTAENSGLEFTTTYCLMLLTKELGAMNIGIKHEVQASVAADSRETKPRAEAAPKRVVSLDDVFGMK